MCAFFMHHSLCRQAPQAKMCKNTQRKMQVRVHVKQTEVARVRGMPSTALGASGGTACGLGTADTKDTKPDRSLQQARWFQGIHLSIVWRNWGSRHTRRKEYNVAISQMIWLITVFYYRILRSMCGYGFRYPRTKFTILDNLRCGLRTAFSVL
jgi:hypothetical protein